MVLSWDKPTPLHDPKEHAEMYQADSAPPGVYQPNMSLEDQMKWKAKKTGYKAGRPQIEIRRNGLVIIVALKHHTYKYCNRVPHQLHISMNGPMHWSFEELDQMCEAIREAKAELELDAIEQSRKG